MAQTARAPWQALAFWWEHQTRSKYTQNLPRVPTGSWSGSHCISNKTPASYLQLEQNNLEPILISFLVARCYFVQHVITKSSCKSVVVMRKRRASVPIIGGIFRMKPVSSNNAHRPVQLHSVLRDIRKRNWQERRQVSMSVLLVLNLHRPILAPSTYRPISAQ